MKKILSFALVLLMLASFAACAPKGNVSDGENVDGAEVEKTVVDFNDALMLLDVEKMLTHVDENAQVYTMFEEFGDVLSLEALRGQLSSEMASAEMETAFEGFFADMRNVLTSKMSYEIVEVSVDGDTARAVVEMAMPQSDSISVDEYMGVYDETKILELVLGQFTDEELESIVTMSEEEANALVLSKMPAVMETVFDEIVVAVDADVKVEEGVTVYVLSKIDGKWLIVDAE